MPVYHSELGPLARKGKCKKIGDFYLLPFRLSSPDQRIPSHLFSASSQTFYDHHDFRYLTSQEDCVDEMLLLFRINSFFKSFQMTAETDPLMVYGLLVVSQLLGKLKATTGRDEAQKLLSKASYDDIALPGDPTFPLNSMYEAVSSKEDRDVLMSYLQLLRQEIATRLLVLLYPKNSKADAPSKWWLSFQKRKFMNKCL